MGMTWEQAIGAVTSAGQPFEFVKATVNGVEVATLLATPIPAALIALTRKPYCWPFDRPVAVCVVEVLAPTLPTTGGSDGDRLSFLVLVLALGGLIAMSARRRTHP